MISWLTYLFDVTICHAVFYFVYLVFFQNLSFIQINRVFLLSSTFVSFIIPAISIPFWNNTSHGIAFTFTKNLEHLEHTLTSPEMTNSGVTAYNINWLFAILGLIYLGGLFLYIWKLFRGIHKILALVNQHEVNEYNGIKTIYLKSGPLFFAFLNYVFINTDKVNISRDEFHQVFDHEKAHIKQKHTIDNLLMELAILICWFNPILRLMKKELNNVHEFYADQEATGITGNIESYSRLILLLSSNKESQNPLIQQFSMNNIKKRIIMLNKKKNPKITLIRYFMIVPCLALLLAAFSFTQKSNENENFVTVENTLQNIRSVTWKGNTRYSDEYLNKYMGINKGDQFNEEAIKEKLNYKPEGGDLASLFMDQGYLYFTVELKKSTNQTNVDLTFEIYEGDVVTVSKVYVTGNDKVETDKIIKMIDLKEGDLFNRSKLIASQRKIVNSGLFDPENLLINPIPNISDKTVDLEFRVTEL